MARTMDDFLSLADDDSVLRNAEYYGRYWGERDARNGEVSHNPSNGVVNTRVEADWAAFCERMELVSMPRTAEHFRLFVHAHSLYVTAFVRTYTRTAEQELRTLAGR